MLDIVFRVPLYYLINSPASTDEWQQISLNNNANNNNNNQRLPAPHWLVAFSFWPSTTRSTAKAGGTNLKEMPRTTPSPNRSVSEKHPQLCPIRRAAKDALVACNEILALEEKEKKNQ